MSGERRRSCLDNLKFELYGRNVRSTESTFGLVTSKEDLAKSLNIEVNAEASGSYGIVTGSASSKTQILKNSVFNSRSILGIGTLVHRAQEIQIESDYQLLSVDALELLQTNKEDFRLRCGDSYTKSVTTGAAMYILFEVTSKSNEISSNATAVNSVKGALGEIFSATASAAVTKESKATLASYNISLSCYSVGITTDACSGSFIAASADDLSGMIAYINEAKKATNNSIQSNPNMMVGVDEILEPYPKPIEDLNQPREKVFFDYSKRLNVLKGLLEKEVKSDAACAANSSPDCVELEDKFAQQIKNCARQEFWADCHPEEINISSVLNSSKPTGIGKLTMWENINGGKMIVLDFDKTSLDPISFQAGQLYDLDTFRFAGIATSFVSELKEGWQVRLFDDVSGRGTCYLIKGTIPQLVDLKRFNDRARSFRLERVGDYPQSCEFN
jgi:hypothetical protein